MLASHLKDFIIVPVLDYLELNSPSAVNLLLLTAAVETDMGYYLRQIGFNFESSKGAFGIYGIELNTDDAITTYLDNPSYKTKKINGTIKYVLDEKRTERKQELFMRIHTLKGMEYMIPDAINKVNLLGNLYYQTAMARCKYLMIPEPLPPADDVEALAVYWKKWYNSEAGKGTVQGAIENYNKYVSRGT